MNDLTKNLTRGAIGRREFLAATATSSLLAACSPGNVAGADLPAETASLLFTSQGKTGIVRADGSGLRYFDLHVPEQVTWQPGPSFADGHRLVLLSMEARHDGPGRPFGQYYTQTPTHLWIYDLPSESLEEICTKDRLAPFITPALLLGEERILVQVVRDQVGQIFNMRLDGTDAHPFTRAGEGLPYGLSLSPDGRRVAFHLASPEGYQIWTSATDGTHRVLIAAHQDHLYFGTRWSPDGKWILYTDCHYRQDPGHDWADVCIGRTDGSTHRVLTTGQSMWFAATYGNPQTRGGGSNVPTWTADGAILFPRRTQNATVAWQYRPNRPDTDHFNRDYHPELAQGGSEICRLDPESGQQTVLTTNDPPEWDFRCSQSPGGRHIAFCRAATSKPPALWIMETDGKNPHPITQGWKDLGADHPRWL